MDPIELLLAHADDGEPVLSVGLEPNTLDQSPRPDGLDQTGHLGDEGADPQDLARQGWGLVAPLGPKGDRLLALAEPLRALRAHQGPVSIFRAPPNLDGLGAQRWRDRVYAPPEADPAQIPRYLCLLGDLDTLSLPLQQVLSLDTFCGRLALDEAGLAAYVDKVLRWERASLPAPPTLAFHTVHDGTEATSVAYRSLVKPTLALLQESAKERLPGPISEEGDIFEPSAASLLEGANRTGGVLFTIGHGQGAPRGGWRSPQEARSRQGALVFGGQQRIEAPDLRDRPFLPGGCWLSLSCFGAGTPAQSLYSPWLRGLSSLQGVGLCDQLPPDGQPGFVSACAQAALANPEGPLGMIGHMDLSWAYSVQDELGRSRAGRFAPMLRSLHQGGRLGCAFGQLYRHLGQANLALSLDEERQARGGAPAEPSRRARLWMERQDLAGFVLLGDPAARIAPFAPRPEPTVSPPAAVPPLHAPGPSEPAPTAPRDWLQGALIERLAQARSVELEEHFEAGTLRRRVLRLRR